MTKANELSVLDAAIEKLGAASYLGPWLASVRAEVERDVRSDLQPMYLPSAALKDAVDIIQAAGDVAAERREAARVHGEALIEAARRDAREIRHCAAKDLRAALTVLEARS